jgi:hypothetical protein
MPIGCQFCPRLRTLPRDFPMNKQELIEAVAATTNESEVNIYRFCSSHRVSRVFDLF